MKRIFNKKSQGLTLNTIVIAILVIIVLLVLIYAFAKNIKPVTHLNSDNCSLSNGNIVKMGYSSVKPAVKGKCLPGYSKISGIEGVSNCCGK